MLILIGNTLKSIIRKKHLSNIEHGITTSKNTVFITFASGMYV